MLTDKLSEVLEKLKSHFPLIVFIVAWLILVGSIFPLLSDFAQYGTFYDYLISCLVFLSLVIGGSTVIGFYCLENYSPLFRWTLGFSIMAFFLSFLDLKWLLLLLPMVLSIYLIHKDFDSNETENRVSKYLKVASTIAILIHPVVIFLLSQQEIVLPAGDGNITTRFYLENKNGDNDFLTEDVIRSLSQHNSGVFLAFTNNLSEKCSGAFEIGNESHLDLLKKLDHHRIKKHAWLLAPNYKGYWADNSNSKLFNKIYKDLEQWKTELDFKSVQLDSEQGLFRGTHSLIGIFSFYPRLVLNYHSGLIRKAEGAYRSLVGEINREYGSSVAAYPFIIEDTLDGDQDLQRLLGVSTYPPEGWKEITPMVYRTRTSQIFNFDVGSYLIYSYAYSWKKRAGNKTSISIAQPGRLGYGELESFTRDVHILDSLGYNKYNVYRLKYFLEEYGEEELPEFFNEVQEPGKVEFKYNPFVSYMRISVALFDRLI